MNSLKRGFNAAIKEVSDLLNENREIKEENVAVFVVCKEHIEGQLQKYCKEFERFEETLEENEENEKIPVNYESVIIEASKLLNQLKGVIKGHQQILEATQRENQRKGKSEKSKSGRKGKSEKGWTWTRKITYRWKASTGESQSGAIKNRSWCKLSKGEIRIRSEAKRGRNQEKGHRSWNW